MATVPSGAGGSIPAAFVRQETDWPVPSAHNGWIDLLVQLGWPGAIAVGSLMVTATIMTLTRLGSSGVREGYWAIAYLGVFVLLSLSESVLMSHAELPWTWFGDIGAGRVAADGDIHIVGPEPPCGLPDPFPNRRRVRLWASPQISFPPLTTTSRRR